jgi:hypothetical protein
VHFDAPSNPIAYIHTETNALGSITDDTKTIMQTIFGVLHTFNFLDSYDNARVILVFILIMFVLGMVISGFCMIFLIKKRQINDKKRYIHRLVANIIWLPLFCFGFSGTYHLLQGKFAENTRGVRLHEAFEMPKVNLGQNFILINDLKEANLNNLSLLKMNDDYIYRASLASEKAMHNTHSEQHQPQKKVDIHDHFNGLAKEKGAIYLNLKGEKINLNDKEIALFYANKAGFKTEDIKDSQLITHFGMNYDFRNKRLPVWQLTMTSNNIIFIDPMTGILVDHVSVAEQYESLSFSMLHKWNFLVPLTGREVRDILTVAFLSTVIFTTILGFIMLIRRRKH